MTPTPARSRAMRVLTSIAWLQRVRDAIGLRRCNVRPAIDPITDARIALAIRYLQR